jgi:hypothetical protein
MRRKAALLALLVFAVPVAARLAASWRDAEAARCALACARAGMGVETGASCCPMGHGAGGLSLSACARDGDAARLPATIGPMLLFAVLALPLPFLSRRLTAGGELPMPFPPSRLLDKVPLLLG